MSKMSLTVKAINNLHPKDKVYEIREGDGFGLRIYPSGEKRFFFFYTLNKKRRQLSIGGYPTLSLKDAHKVRDKLKNLVAKGIDPIEKKQTEEEENKRITIHTIKDLGEKFIEEHCKKNKKSWKEDERIFRKYILNSNIKNLPPKDVTRNQIQTLLKNIISKDGKGKVMANRAFAFLNTMFRFALNEENNVLEHSPCFGMKKPGGKEKKKTRYLKDDEIIKFWNGLNDSLIAPPIINALKLILLTGQRPSEICGIHSDEINNRWWTIPGERTKNGSDHSVYLSDLALKTIGSKNGYKFISPVSQKQLDRFQLSQVLSRKFAPLANGKNKTKHIPTNPDSRTYPRRWDFEKFTPHDLRRTCATHLVGLGFNQLLVGHILNHTDQSVTAIYNQYSYDKEKQLAMEAWERKIIELVGLNDKESTKS